MAETPLAASLRDAVVTPSPAPIEDFAVLIDFVEPRPVVRIRGDLDAHTAPTLGGVLRGLVDHGHHQLVLDLSKMAFIGAGGLGVIAGIAGVLRREGGELTLRGPDTRARQLLSITGIIQRLHVEAPAEHGSLAELTSLAWRTTRRDTIDLELDEIVAGAVRAIASADGASVSLDRQGRTATAAASDDVVQRMDDSQYATGEGPCLLAAATGTRIDVGAMGEEVRWPAFVPRALELGIGSVVSTPLVTDAGAIGALNIYSRSDHAFDAHEVEIAAVFATRAAIVAQALPGGLDSAEMDVRLAAALASRSILAMAQGVLMERLHVTADDASSVLHRAARQEVRSTLEEASAVLASVPAADEEPVDDG